MLNHALISFVWWCINVRKYLWQGARHTEIRTCALGKNSLVQTVIWQIMYIMLTYFLTQWKQTENMVRGMPAQQSGNRHRRIKKQQLNLTMYSIVQRPSLQITFKTKTLWCTCKRKYDNNKVHLFSAPNSHRARTHTHTQTKDASVHTVFIQGNTYAHDSSNLF